MQQKQRLPWGLFLLQEPPCSDKISIRTKSASFQLGSWTLPNGSFSHRSGALAIGLRIGQGLACARLIGFDANLFKEDIPVAAIAAPTEAELREFLARENLGYQGIDLPYGLVTPGDDRQQAKEIAFSPSVQGKSVLDIGSYLGAFCIEALRRGASRAVGMELNLDRIRLAREIAGFLNLHPEYIHADVEDRPLGEKFDVVLCLNVLHHMRDAVGTLRYLALNTKERLVIEAASLGSHDCEKHGLHEPLEQLEPSLMARFRLGHRAERQMPVGELLNKYPVAYIGPCEPSGLNQTYFFTSSGLKRILDGHMRLFQRIEETESEFKGRYLLNCTRLRIDRMIVVAGANSSGKSTLCSQIMQNDFAEPLGIADMSRAHFVAPSRVWRNPLEEWFARSHYDTALYHYDLSLIDKRKLHSFRRDPATDLLHCADRLDFVIVAPTRETLKRQAALPEPDGKPKGKFHHECLKLYDQPSYLLNLYSDWIEFIAPFKGRFLVYIEKAGERVMLPCPSKDAALTEIKRLYSP
jgi:SAM-dependent methyltransferase